MNKRKEIMKKIFCEGFLNYAGYTTAEIDMKKLEKAPHKRKRMRCVTREELDLKPVPKEIVRLHYFRRFTKTEFRKLSYGLCPADKDEKWFIFLENNRLYFYRRRSGECIYLLRIEEYEHFYFVKEAWINANVDYHTEEYVVKFLDYLIDRLLLSKAVSFPFPEHINEPLERAFFRYEAVGSSVANDED